MRLETHPILDFDRGQPVQFVFDGKTLNAFSNESIAAALLANGVQVLRHSVGEHRPRGFFCGIGRCASCSMIVNNVPDVRACITAVEDGMIVETQKGLGVIHE